MATKKAITKPANKSPLKIPYYRKKKIIMTLERVSEIFLIGEVVGIEKDLQMCRRGCFVQEEATDSDELQGIRKYLDAHQKFKVNY